MTEYAAGDYKITGPRTFNGGTRCGTHADGEIVTLTAARQPDEDGDLCVYRQGSTEHAGYIVATSLTPIVAEEPKPSDFKVGDFVTVSAGASEAYFGKECEAEVISIGSTDVRVRTTDGTRTSDGADSQYVLPRSLTKRNTPAEPNPEADTVNVLALTEALGFLGVDEDIVSKAITLAKLIEKGV